MHLQKALHFEKMNDVALALYDRAYEKYRDEGDTLIDRITILRGLDGDDYKKYRDELSDYYKDGDYLLNKLTSMSDAEFNAFLAEVDAYESDREYEYNKYLDSVEQRNFYDRLQMENNQFNDEMDFKESEAERDQRNKDREYSLSLSKSSGSSASSRSSSSSGRSGSSGSKSDNNSTKTTVVPKSYSQFVYYTGYAGILTESEFNSRKASKEKYGNYENYLVEMFAKYGGKQ
ncbi:MAG: hypothetical protein IKC01_06030 [Clostridia bacterium]|nr:hypothetical protein [Clostridia bacterium]